MSAYLSFEWLKLSKRWMPRVILFLLLALTVIAFWGEGTRIDGRANLFLPRAWLSALTFSAFFAPFFWPVLGGSWAGNEYGWGTIRTILTRRPYRIQHVVAAFAVLAVGVGVAILAIMVVASAAGALVAALTGNAAFTSGILSGSFLGTVGMGFLTAWLVSSFYLLVAYAAAVIFRSTAVGIGLGIGSVLAQIVLNQIFVSLGGVWKTIATHMPFTYTSDVITRVVHSGLVSGTGLSRVSPTAPSASQSLIAIAIYSAVVVALMLLAVSKRDVTA